MRLGKLIEQKIGVVPTLTPGSGGVFDVLVDGKLIFSKHHEGTFPDEDELLEELAEMAMD